MYRSIHCTVQFVQVSVANLGLDELHILLVHNIDMLDLPGLLLGPQQRPHPDHKRVTDPLRREGGHGLSGERGVTEDNVPTRSRGQARTVAAYLQKTLMFPLSSWMMLCSLRLSVSSPLSLLDCSSCSLCCTSLQSLLHIAAVQHTAQSALQCNKLLDSTPVFSVLPPEPPTSPRIPWSAPTHEPWGRQESHGRVVPQKSDNSQSKNATFRSGTVHFSPIHLEASSSCLLPARDASSAALLLLSSATLVLRPSTWWGREEGQHLVGQGGGAGLQPSPRSAWPTARPPGRSASSGDCSG